MPDFSYNQSERSYQSPEIRALVLDQAELIEDLIGRRTVESTTNEHRANGSSMRSMSFLLGLILWVRHLRNVTPNS
jgi:hypothetical protein